MPMDGFTRLVFALEAEEGVLLASFVEADHPGFFFVDALGVVGVAVGGGRFVVR